jgi:hypothetical protein
MSRALKEQIQPLIFTLNNMHLSLSLFLCELANFIALYNLLHIQLSCYRGQRQLRY